MRRTGETLNSLCENIQSSDDVILLYPLIIFTQDKHFSSPLNEAPLHITDMSSALNITAVITHANISYCLFVFVWYQLSDVEPKEDFKINARERTVGRTCL